MIVQVITNGQIGSGLLDGEYRRGDIEAVHDDTFVPGTIGRKTRVFIKIPDPPNLSDFQSQIVSEEFRPGPSSEENLIAAARRFYFPYWTHFTPDQLDIAEAVQEFPDGEFDGGGNVVNGIIEDRFTAQDIRRK